MINSLDEFKEKISLAYQGGFSGENSAGRRYHDKQLNIGAELHTPKKNGVWGNGEMTYYFEDSKKVHASTDELYEEYKIRQGNDIPKNPIRAIDSTGIIK